MVLCEDSECSVCLLPYSRMDRVPRVLHCRHTFCELCLDTMSQARSGMLHVRCPLCRRVTCVGLGLSLQEALWVDSERWDQIPDGVAAGEDGDEDGCQLRAGEARTQAQQKPSLQAEWWVAMQCLKNWHFGTLYIFANQSKAQTARLPQEAESDQAAPGEDHPGQQRVSFLFKTVKQT
uniref:Im:7152348 n=1 Tax=Salarias fasciatus TaxID=181472 RepID=A0A672ISA4_SALFA